MKETTLAERLKMAMDTGKFTQAKLASATGMAQPSIWKLLSGKALSSTKILQLSRVLNVRAEWLSEGKGPMNDNSSNDIAEIKRSYDDVFSVDVYGKNGLTGERVLVPDSVKSKTCRAYRLNVNSGCAEAPSGTLIVVDIKEIPGTNDLVYAHVNELASVYRFMQGGSFGFLAVDDPRIPLLELTSKSSLIGVIVYLSRSLRRK
ncbi:helix-turn-helix transcriptional regulator [Candidatus Fukatsuia symbiotica]|uniref:Transcriptional regulator n=1 Tax=Candidatus Fukatsuia symbiotica TaxID=1878942 RepID=A0A2U8I4Q5_9GAMM|nr:helix-turn-helix transcriptional regulator [Candidatus Fukatsuia symbiotica]AWK14127.1 transcriptional regulator [Candidatus Fukatsuia symbiotica]MEA9446321.1 helix-turn-helix transcriptional regulator [Candidatus Fukatsuia symbiotica]